MGTGELDAVMQYTDATPADYAHCRHVMERASKNYSFASLALPANRRHHVDALYALLRVGDDRVDVSHEGYASPLAAIDAWEEAYWRAFEAGTSPDPVMRAYHATAQERGIPAEVMRPYFRAMKDDLTVTRFPTFEDLMHYMDGSAIPVGRAMTYILGARGPHTVIEALPYADHLSVAMQLSNFWRDVGEDWEKGRVYLPLEDMEHFSVTAGDLAAERVTDNLIDLLEFEFSRTEKHYTRAKVGVYMLGSGRLAVMTALNVYRAIIDGIRENKYDVFKLRAGTSKLGKLRLMGRAWLSLMDPFGTRRVAA